MKKRLTMPSPTAPVNMSTGEEQSSSEPTLTSPSTSGNLSSPRDGRRGARSTEDRSTRNLNISMTSHGANATPKPKVTSPPLTMSTPSKPLPRTRPVVASYPAPLPQRATRQPEHSRKHVVTPPEHSQAKVLVLSAPASPSPPPSTVKRDVHTPSSTQRTMVEVSDQSEYADLEPHSCPAPTSPSPAAATASYATALRSPPQRRAVSPTSGCSSPEPRATTTDGSRNYPPIVVDALPDWPFHLGELRRRLGHIPNARPLDKGVRFRPKSAEEFRAVQDYLTEAQQQNPGIAWHGYSLGSMKPHKVALWGLPEGTEPSVIKQALISLNFPATFVRVLPKRKNARKTVFFIQLDNMKKDQLARLYDTTELLNMPRVVIEGWRGGTTVPQCHRCQQFGHASANCHRPKRCVKCAGPHFGSECPKLAGWPSICANCRGSHAANSRQCAVFRREARKRNIRIPGDFRPPAQHLDNKQSETHQRSRRASQGGTAAGQTGPPVPTPAPRTRSTYTPSKPTQEEPRRGPHLEERPVTTLRPPANLPGTSAPQKRSRKRRRPAKNQNQAPRVASEIPPTQAPSTRVPRHEWRRATGGKDVTKVSGKPNQIGRRRPAPALSAERGAGTRPNTGVRAARTLRATVTQSRGPQQQPSRATRPTAPRDYPEPNNTHPRSGEKTTTNRDAIMQIVRILVELVASIAAGEDIRSAANVARVAAAVSYLTDSGEERSCGNAGA